MYINYRLGEWCSTISTENGQKEISVKPERVLANPGNGEVVLPQAFEKLKSGTLLVVLDKWRVCVGYETIAYFDTKEEAEALHRQIMQNMEVAGEAVMEV